MKNFNSSMSDWEYLRQSIDYYIHRVRFITTLREGVLLLYDISIFVISIIVKSCFCIANTATIDDENDDERLRRYRREKSNDLLFNHIATTYAAFYIYAVVALSMITHQLWILHGISIYIVGTILTYAIKWVMYTLDDHELITNYKFLRGWIYIFLHQGEEILNGDAAWKFVSAYMMIQQAPTGLSYIRYVLRYKTRKLRKQFLVELGGNRFNMLSLSALKSKVTASLYGARANSNSSSGDDDANKMFTKDGFYEEVWHNDKHDVELVLQQNKKKWR